MQGLGPVVKEPNLHTFLDKTRLSEGLFPKVANIYNDNPITCGSRCFFL